MLSLSAQAHENLNKTTLRYVIVRRGDNNRITAIPCTYDEEAGCHVASQSHMAAFCHFHTGYLVRGLDGKTVPEDEQEAFYVPAQEELS